MTANIHDHGTRRDYPNWFARGKIKKVAPNGDVLDGYAFNGEVVAISPRYQRNGQNYRVRFERPAAAFAAFLFENGLLPELLTPEECEQEWALALLDPLWERTKHRFAQLASPYAACDAATTPSHRTGFSFNIPQVLVEHLGSVRPVAGKPRTFRPVLSGTNGHGNGVDLEAARRTILAMRARAGNNPAAGPAPAPATEPTGVQEDDPELAEMRAEMAALRASEAAATNGEGQPEHDSSTTPPVVAVPVEQTPAEGSAELPTEETAASGEQPRRRGRRNQ